MSCPVCGANCRCRNRGPQGLCCSCHSHKVGGKRLSKGSPELRAWREQHGYEPQQRLITDTLETLPAIVPSTETRIHERRFIWYDRLNLICFAIAIMANDALWPDEPWIPGFRCDPM